MDEEPYYIYVSQTDKNYRVRTGAGTILNVPKNRETPEKYPVELSTSLKRLYKLFLLSVLGLVASGPINVLLSPFVIANYRSVLVSEKNEAKNILYSFLIILVLSVILSVIFVVHIIY